MAGGILVVVLFSLLILGFLRFLFEFIDLNPPTPAEKRKTKRNVEEHRKRVRSKYEAYKRYGLTLQHHAYAKQGLETLPGTMVYWNKKLPRDSPYPNPVKVERVWDSIKSGVAPPGGSPTSGVAFGIRDIWGDIHYVDCMNFFKEDPEIF